MLRSSAAVEELRCRLQRRRDRVDRRQALRRSLHDRDEAAGEFISAEQHLTLVGEVAEEGAFRQQEGVAFRDIAGVIGDQLGVPVVSVAPEDAPDHFGFLGWLVALDNPTSSALTREQLGWRPEHPALIPDLKARHYFA